MSARLAGRGVLLAADCAPLGDALASALTEEGARVHRGAARGLARAEDAARLSAEAVAALGALDAVIVLALSGGDSLTATLDAQLKGPFHAARAALPHLKAQGGALVLAAGGAGGDCVARSAAASGLATLTRCIAYQYGPYGVRANAVILGEADLPPGAAHALAQGAVDPVPLLMLLASGDGSYMTGAVLHLPGSGP